MVGVYGNITPSVPPSALRGARGPAGVALYRYCAPGPRLNLTRQSSLPGCLYRACTVACFFALSRVAASCCASISSSDKPPGFCRASISSSLSPKLLVVSTAAGLNTDWPLALNVCPGSNTFSPGSTPGSRSIASVANMRRFSACCASRASASSSVKNGTSAGSNSMGTSSWAASCA